MARGLLLLSGGIDSPVAGWMVKRAGHELAAVHFASEPFVGPEVAEKCGTLCGKIGISDFSIVQIGEILEGVAKEAPFTLYYVLQKRLILKLAEKMAKGKGCSFLVTGENLGQVSSQTLRNLSVINSATRIPIVRPLVAFDKEEIIKIARKIGTFEISKGPEACCVLGPKHPATGADLKSVLEAEETLISKVKGWPAD
jgi:thiamine biosynthesis protein ThiI